MAEIIKIVRKLDDAKHGYYKNGVFVEYPFDKLGNIRDLRKFREWARRVVLDDLNHHDDVEHKK